MLPQNGSEEKYQIATLVVLTITGLVVIFYAIIFLNPRVAFNPFKPPLPPATFSAALPTLQPTWTPTEVSSPVPTAAPPSSATATLVVPPPPTLAPPTATNAPTIPPTATSRPPTRTPAPTSATLPTPIPSPYNFRSVLQSCNHSGSTQIKGKVSSGGQPQDGLRVRLATGPDPATVVEEQTVKRDVDGSTIYAFILPPIGSKPFSWFVWLVDTQGNALSSPNFRVEMNSYPPSSPDACWLAVVDFVK